jgi:hypothetical protein
MTDDGFRLYTKCVVVNGCLTLLILSPRSIGYSEECLGLHIGDLHDANLGDGNGRKSEEFLARQYYFPVWGTCWESLAGTSMFLDVLR